MESPVPDPAASAMLCEARRQNRPSTSFPRALVSSTLVLLFLLVGAATMWFGLSMSPLFQMETVPRRAPSAGHTAFWRQAHVQQWGSAASGGKASSTAAATNRKLKSTLQVFEDCPPAAAELPQEAESPGKPSISILTIQADSRVWFKRSPSPPRGVQKPLQVIMGASLHVVPSGPNPLHN